MKTDQQLRQQAAMLHAEADALLHQDGLLDVVRSFGLAHVAGSYGLDLMTWRDLDLRVQLPLDHDTNTFFQLGAQLAQQFVIHKATFSNQFIRADVPFDHGLYWGIRLEYQQQLWKIDLWGYGPQHYQAHVEQDVQLQAVLATADHVAILRIKDVLCQDERYRYDVTSMHIYQAVTTAGITTVDEFWWWREQRSNTPLC